jgi:heat shock protein HslJ/membrane-bound inhibitor of C-type lysozyme
MKKARSVFAVAAVAGLAACGNKPLPVPQAPMANAAEYACGDIQVQIGMAGDAAVRRVEGADYILSVVEAPTGAKYVADDFMPVTGFWSKGNEGVLTLAGVDYPECTQTGGEGAPPVEAPANWTACGQEPGWMLTVAGGMADFVYDYGAQGYSALLPEPRAIEGGIGYFEGPGGLAITSIAKVCADSATGVPYPDTVTVAFSDEVYEGCGGDPLALLVGADWVVEDINSGGLVAGSRVSLAFDAAEGLIGGRSGCNAFGADYSVDGEGIGFGPVMSTEIACKEALMMQERRFYDALALINAYTIDESGALVMTGAEDVRIVARR